jgi:hypothetical protein
MTVISKDNQSNPDIQKILRATKNQMREWTEAAFSRISGLRNKRAAASPDQIKILEDQIAHDLKIVDEGYQQMRDLLQTHVQHLCEADERKVFVLSEPEQNGLIQGVMSLKTESDKVYIDILMSPPWNNSSMYSPVCTEHLPLQVKGAGFTLMKIAYMLAAKKHLPCIELKPLSESLPFYLHIGMSYDEKNCHLPIQIPIPPRFAQISLDDESREQLLNL